MTNSSIATAAKASTSETATAAIATVLFVSISSADIVVATTKVKDAVAFIAHTGGVYSGHPPSMQSSSYGPTRSCNSALRTTLDGVRVAECVLE